MEGSRFALICTCLVMLVAHGSAAICKVIGCKLCDTKQAVCDTNSSTGPIPQNLSPSITYLNIKRYTGPPINMTPAMFERYPNLSSVLLCGNFIGIESKTFAAQSKLRYVSITYTNISALPADAFGNTTHLQKLVMHHNKFNAFPLSLFKSLVKISKLDLSYNPVDVCKPNVTSIGYEFAQLKTLMHLSLEGIGSAETNCTNIGDDFFKPLAHVSYLLNISRSCFLTGSTAIFNNLHKVQLLDVSATYPLTECPRHIGEFLTHLPANSALQSLLAGNLRSQITAFSENCTILPSTLQGLNSTKLKNFQQINFDGCDSAFGNTLPGDIFSNMNALEKVHLSFTGIEQISPNALRGVDIIELYLDGNPLGTRPFDVGEKRGQWYIETLSVSNIGIRSDRYMVYNLYKFISNLENLSKLDLSNNLIAELPCFTSKPINYSQFSVADCVKVEDQETSIETLDISGNLLETLSESRMITACNVMPDLHALRAESNRLHDVSGLCTSIENLYLANNYLGWYAVTSLYPRLKQLTQLKRLDLSRNSIKYLDPDVFSKMESLNTLIMQDNPLTTLPDIVFSTNSELVKIDFTSCFFVDFGSIMKPMKKLGKLNHLYLKYNQLQSFAPSIIDIVESDLKSLTSFSILGNPFKCDCNIGGLQNWLGTSKKVIDVMNITCGGQEHAADTISIFDYYPPLFRCKILLPLIIGSAVLAFCLLVLLACLPCICMRWYISHRKIVLPVVKKALKEIRYGYRCDYDAVICYDFSSDEDKQWVVDHLIPELEGDEQHPGNVSVCYTLTCNVRVSSQLHVHCTCYLSGPANLLCNIKEFGNIDENELQHGAYSRK